MISFKPSPSYDEDLPFTWRNYIDPDGKAFEINPVIVDSKNHYLSIHKHTIAPDGTVSPSVVCPAKDCGFHEFIKLEGWKGKQA